MDFATVARCARVKLIYQKQGNKTDEEVRAILKKYKGHEELLLRKLKKKYKLSVDEISIAVEKGPEPFGEEEAAVRIQIFFRIYCSKIKVAIAKAEMTEHSAAADENNVVEKGDRIKTDAALIGVSQRNGGTGEKREDAALIGVSREKGVTEEAAMVDGNNALEEATAKETDRAQKVATKNVASKQEYLTEERATPEASIVTDEAKEDAAKNDVSKEDCVAEEKVSTDASTVVGDINEVTINKTESEREAEAEAEKKVTNEEKTTTGESVVAQSTDASTVADDTKDATEKKNESEREAEAEAEKKLKNEEKLTTGEIVVAQSTDASTVADDTKEATEKKNALDREAEAEQKVTSEELIATGESVAMQATKGAPKNDHAGKEKATVAKGDAPKENVATDEKLAIEKTEIDKAAAKENVSRKLLNVEVAAEEMVAAEAATLDIVDAPNCAASKDRAEEAMVEESSAAKKAVATTAVADDVAAKKTATAKKATGKERAATENIPGENVASAEFARSSENMFSKKTLVSELLSASEFKLRAIFDRIDSNGDGVLSLNEFCRMIALIKDLPWDARKPREVVALFRSIDKNDNKRISWEEFYAEVVQIRAAQCNSKEDKLLPQKPPPPAPPKKGEKLPMKKKNGTKKLASAEVTNAVKVQLEPSRTTAEVAQLQEPEVDIDDDQEVFIEEARAEEQLRNEKRERSQTESLASTVGRVSNEAETDDLVRMLEEQAKNWGAMVQSSMVTTDTGETSFRDTYSHLYDDFDDAITTSSLVTVEDPNGSIRNLGGDNMNHRRRAQQRGSDAMSATDLGFIREDTSDSESKQSLSYDAAPYGGSYSQLNGQQEAALRSTINQQQQEIRRLQRVVHESQQFADQAAQAERAQASAFIKSMQEEHSEVIGRLRERCARLQLELRESKTEAKNDDGVVSKESADKARALIDTMLTKLERGPKRRSLKGRKPIGLDVTTLSGRVVRSRVAGVVPIGSPHRRLPVLPPVDGPETPVGEVGTTSTKSMPEESPLSELGLWLDEADGGWF